MGYGEIVEKWGLPRKDVSCPYCGRVYGHHNTKVCMTCEECSKCCRCVDDKFYLSADDYVAGLE